MTGLKRTLGAVQLTAIGLAAVIGSGIFVLSGQAAARFAGPAVVLSFLLAGFVALLAALCVAELATAVPVSGGAFAFAYTVHGALIGWLVAWALIVEYLVGASVMAIGWSGDAADGFGALGLRLPQDLRAGPFEDDPGVVNLYAVFLVLGAGAPLIRGASESATVNAALVAIKMVALGLFVVVGATASRFRSRAPSGSPESSSCCRSAPRSGSGCGCSWGWRSGSRTRVAARDASSARGDPPRRVTVRGVRPQTSRPWAVLAPATLGRATTGGRGAGRVQARDADAGRVERRRDRRERPDGGR